MAGGDCHTKKEKITFILDSGASDHIVKRVDLFSRVKVTKNSKILIKGKPLNNLTGVDFVVKNKNIKIKRQANNIVCNNYEMWHQGLGHIEKSKFTELQNKQMIIIYVRLVLMVNRSEYFFKSLRTKLM